MLSSFFVLVLPRAPTAAGPQVFVSAHESELHCEGLTLRESFFCPVAAQPAKREASFFGGLCMHEE